MKNKNTKDIATRMKGYEKSSKHYLTPRVPIMLRIDGRAFHTFTKGFAKPFDDEILLKAMRQTMKTLCEMIPGCVFGYTQSDEITLVILDQNTQAEPWFGFCQNKIESITASMATMVFNQAFYKAYQGYYKRLMFAMKYYKALYGSNAYDWETEQCLSNNIVNIHCKFGRLEESECIPLDFVR